MYIMWVCLFSALTHRVGALQISIIIIIMTCNTIHARQIRQRQAAWTFTQGTITTYTEPMQPVQTSKMHSVIFATNTFYSQARKLANSDARGSRYACHRILVYRVLYCMVQGKKVAAVKEKSWLPLWWEKHWLHTVSVTKQKSQLPSSFHSNILRVLCIACDKIWAYFFSFSSIVSVLKPFKSDITVAAMVHALSCPSWVLGHTRLDTSPGHTYDSYWKVIVIIIIVVIFVDILEPCQKKRKKKKEGRYAISINSENHSCSIFAELHNI